MIVKPGPVIDFLQFNQKVDSPWRIDWAKVIICFSHLIVAHAIHMFTSETAYLLQTGKKNAEESEDQGYYFQHGIQNQWVK